MLGGNIEVMWIENKNIKKALDKCKFETEMLFLSNFLSPVYYVIENTDPMILNSNVSTCIFVNFCFNLVSI